MTNDEAMKKTLGKLRHIHEGSGDNSTGKVVSKENIFLERANYKDHKLIKDKKMKISY